MTSVTPEPDSVDELTAAPAAELTASSLYFNRELSWLDFNDRVLQLAEDASIPLLERVKFCAIYTSNLDEFFMVRVAGLHDQLEAGIDARGPDGVSAGEAIAPAAKIEEMYHPERFGVTETLRVRAKGFE